MELARVVRERAELSTRYGARHPEMVRVSQEEAALRDVARAEDGASFRGAMIRALSDELADALADRRALATQYGEAHPQMRAAQSVIAALTAAINTEVHSAG